MKLAISLQMKIIDFFEIIMLKFRLQLYPWEAITRMKKELLKQKDATN